MRTTSCFSSNDKREIDLGRHPRLLRMSKEPSIRANLLETFLKPLPEGEQETIFVDGEIKIVSGAKVEPLDLSRLGL